MKLLILNVWDIKILTLEIFLDEIFPLSFWFHVSLSFTAMERLKKIQEYKIYCFNK